MAQQLLNRPEVGPGLKQMRGITMAQPVGCNLRPHTAPIEVLQYDSSGAPLAQAAAQAVEKQRRRLGGFPLRPRDQIAPPAKIAPQGGDGLRPHRDDPLLTSLAFYPDKTPQNVQVPHIQPRQFAQSDTRGIKELKDRRIAGTRGILLAGR